MITATCANILAILASATGGETIQLSGTCAEVNINRTYKQRVIVDASKATVLGVRVTEKGGNITWRGGVIKAPQGKYGFAANGYGLKINGVDVTIENVKVTDSKKGLVLNKASRVVIANNVFDGVSDDGIIAAASTQVSILTNTFRNSTPLPTQCTFTNGSVAGLSSRDCLARGGQWADGYHADAIQMRDGMSRVLIAGNTVTGQTQGITQMDTEGDAPLSNITIRENTVSVSSPHSITLFENCTACKILSNNVTRGPGSPWKAVIRPALAIACGNRVQDSKIGTTICN